MNTVVVFQNQREVWRGQTREKLITTDVAAEAETALHKLLEEQKIEEGYCDISLRNQSDEEIDYDLVVV